MFGNDEKMLEAVDAMFTSNWSHALKLLQKLSLEGVADAKHFMGWFYEQGIEVPQSDSEAFNWWSKAAIDGVPESQNAIANMYRDGRGTEVNLEKAYYWYSVAYKNGDSASFADAKAIGKKLTVEQLNTLNEKLTKHSEG